MAFVDALVNAAAVWFVLKAIEVTPTATYDIIALLKTWKAARGADDVQGGGTYYDTRRGKLEYLFSGTHFGDVRLLRKSKKWLLISTFIPIIVFVLESMSIFLSNEARSCQTSRDLDVVSAPGLELFGEGKRHISIETLLQQFSDAPFARPCVVWSSSNLGVDYRSSICTNLGDLLDFGSLVRKALPSTVKGGRWVKLLMPKNNTVPSVYLAVVFLGLSGPPDRVLPPLGHLSFVSEVLVNGKSVLYSDTTSTGIVSEKTREELQKHVRLFEDFTNLTHSEYYETENLFGFHWNTVDQFSFRVFAVVQAILAQATRVHIRTAAQMSSLNKNLFTSGRNPEGIDISCQDDYVLPRTASIIIIVTAIVIRLLLIALPASLSSVEFALERAQQPANSEEGSAFLMNRKRIICGLEGFNDDKK